MMLSFELKSAKQVTDVVYAILKRAGYTNIMAIAIRDGAHWTFVGENPEPPHGQELFYLKWERTLFHTAGIYIPQLKGTKGACTINVEYVDKALEFPGCTLLFANGERHTIYAIDAQEFLDKSYERPQEISQEVTRCIAVEQLQPWGLLERFGAQVQRQQGKETSNEGEDTVMILQCEDCNYAKVQSKQDIQAIELRLLGWGNEASHSKTFDHKMKITRVSKSDPYALQLRNALQRWEKW